MALPQHHLGAALRPRPAISRNTIGILPNILNTLYIIIVAMVIVLPLGVGAAIYLTEYAANRQAGRASSSSPPRHLRAFPPSSSAWWACCFFVQKLGLQAGILAGGLTLVMMILPTIIRTTQESLKTVPQSYREGALALGAGKWRMVRTVVLPGCSGRHRHRLYSGHRPHRGRERRAAVYRRLRAWRWASFRLRCTASGATLTVALYVYANERRRDSAWPSAIATILMVLTLLINLTAGAHRAEAEKEGGTTMDAHICK